VMVDVYYLYTNTLNFTRNTSGIVNTNVNQRKSNTTWFNKNILMNSIK